MIESDVQWETDTLPFAPPFAWQTCYAWSNSSVEVTGSGYEGYGECASSM